ncbi:MAG: protease inhibitor I42 family protein [Gammaproteobacteria bacterium]|nr:protease inhibitor I42 family protein [Gammaproteobacteria bacterium]
MNKVLKVTGAVVAALLLSATAYAQHSDAPKQTINVSSQQHLVKIALPANATTGYQWYVSNYNTDLLTLTAYHYLAPTNHRIGAGGTAEFIFSVKPGFHVAPQITNVSFVYGQSWDMNGETTRTVTLTSIPAYSTDMAKHETKKPSMHETKKNLMHTERPSHTDMNSSMPADDSSATSMPSNAAADSNMPAAQAPAADANLTAPAPAIAPAPASTTPAATSWLSIPGQS